LHDLLVFWLVGLLNVDDANGRYKQVGLANLVHLLHVFSQFKNLLQVPGGNMRDSFLVNGVAFKKTFSYAGFEQQPKKFINPKILLLNIELELKSEKENAEIR